MANKFDLVLDRVFDAPRELVWQAWADPEQKAQWWGPLGFTTTTLRYELRVGGVWQQVMRGPDGFRRQQGRAGNIARAP